MLFIGIWHVQFRQQSVNILNRFTLFLNVIIKKTACSACMRQQSIWTSSTEGIPLGYQSVVPFSLHSDRKCSSGSMFFLSSPGYLGVGYILPKKCNRRMKMLFNKRWYYLVYRDWSGTQKTQALFLHLPLTCFSECVGLFAVLYFFIRFSPLSVLGISTFLLRDRVSMHCSQHKGVLVLVGAFLPYYNGRKNKTQTIKDVFWSQLCQWKIKITQMEFHWYNSDVESCQL